MIADPTEEDDSSKESNDTTDNASLMASRKKTGGNRHCWRHQNVVGKYYDQTTKKKRYCKVFLDDKNNQDLLFSELLISDQPYRATAKTKELEIFVIKMQSAGQFDDCIQLLADMRVKDKMNWSKNVMEERDTPF